ncbi:E3 ubiquitin-protein ligase UBR3-like [Xenia sp. Carnegie-2017]|uniref:E3 ubiquitin-protein ligase UBR3-like n=1 Tax=Xenia sp. Carnegie-2017 TaxID=2897299 RepID=UPI001F038B8F|nr:E3 ubiquitin-protein ligase UBR3-like [Xenia sp. Carnegie-2017]
MADFLSREKQTASALLKAQFGTEKGKAHLNGVLKTLFGPQKKFTKDTKDWCKCLIAGGQNPDSFFSKLKEYNSSQVCGLVWHKNFVAFRCRDCGISPCMSICADCFHAADHTGHDYNMFRSHAGGACDCGDENVMKKEGFCPFHGKKKKMSSGPPDENLDMARAIIPHLFNCICQSIKTLSNSADAISCAKENNDKVLEFLQELSEGEILRGIICDMVMDDSLKFYVSNEDVTKKENGFSSLNLNLLPPEDIPLSNGRFSCYLDMLLELCLRHDFPEKLVTFLLQLLPNQEYKIAFTRKFCESYHKIAQLLTSYQTLSEVEHLSNSIVHVSVQLFSNKNLITKMVVEYKFLHVMVKILSEMMRPVLQQMKVNGQYVKHLVINCDSHVVRYHCYWPIVSDIINVVTHHNIADIFMKDLDLLEKWMNFIARITGINCNERIIGDHVSFEPSSYNAAFFMEVEAAASPMWSLISALSALNDKKCVLNVLEKISSALFMWQKKVNNQPSRAEVHFHIPLLRYFSAFLKQALLQFHLCLEDIEVDHCLLVKLLDWPVCIQAAVCEIRAGLWARNGHQIFVQSAWYQQCHFSNSMLDLDIFYLQICAAHLDPEYFLGVLIDRFRVEHWFQFPSELESCSPGLDDGTKDVMVEGLLTLIITIVSCRLHCGMDVEETLRLEMVTLLCFSDRTHSKLLENVPEKYGQAMNAQLFEKVLNEIADYRNPGWDNSGMQQGTYVLKPKYWDSHFDPVHALMRAFSRKEFQSSMDRYVEHVRKSTKVNVNSAWPPFRSVSAMGRPKSLNGVMRILHCKKLHQMIYLILHKATSNVTTMSETILYLTIHLMNLAVESSPSCFSVCSSSYKPFLNEVGDIPSVVALKCLKFLDEYGINVKGLHIDEDFIEVNDTLMVNIMYDPYFILCPKSISVRDVSKILGHTLFYKMEPSLFGCLLPYISNIMNHTTNLLNQSERENHLQVIQYFLETMPAHRYMLAKQFVSYLIKYMEREQIFMKNVSLICDRSVSSESTVLFTYLIKYHQRLFRVYPRTDGLPKDIFSLEFPSDSLVDNINHHPSIVPEGKTMLKFYTQASLEEDLQDSLQSSSSFDLTADVVKELIEITQIPEDSAICLLQKSNGNLQIAISMYFENGACANESMETKTKDCSLSMDVDHCDNTDENTNLLEENGTSTSSHLQDSIVDLLVRLRTLLVTLSSPLSPRCPGAPVVNDAVQKVSSLLQLIRRLGSSNVEMIGNVEKETLREENRDVDSLNEQEKKKKKVKEHRQRILDELKRQREKFEKTFCSKASTSEINTECSSSSAKLFHCAICGQSAPSTEQRPIGYVVFIQPGTVLKNRHKRCSRSTELYYSNNGHSSCQLFNEVSNEIVCCGSITSARRKFLLTYFEKMKATQACELGIDGGVHVQSCGHCVHLECHQSYLQSLKDDTSLPGNDNALYDFDVNNEEFLCPVCRRPGNSILPILPSDILKSCKRNKVMCYKDILCELETTMKKSLSNSWSKLTTCALQPSVLSTSVTFLVETINRLHLNKERGGFSFSQCKFSLIVATVRSVLEAEHIAIQTGKFFSSRKCFFGTLLQTFQFQCQTLVRPMYHVFNLLTGQCVESCEQMLEEDTSINDVPLLLGDCVCLLLKLMLSWPAPLGYRHFQCLVQMVFNVVLIQAMVKTCCSLSNDERNSWKSRTTRCKGVAAASCLSTEVILSLVCSLLADSKICQASEECLGISHSIWSPQSIEVTLQQYCLPFLRLVSSLSSLCYSTKSLTIQDGENEFFLLTKSLGLHDETVLSSTFSVSDCFKWSHMPLLELIKTWCDQFCHASSSHDTFPKDQLPGMDEWELPKLIKLPESYCSLFRLNRRRSCDKCGSIPEEPTICLVCGAFLCLRGECCQRDNTRECVQHAIECGYGTAVFLMLMSSSVFVIRGEKASVWGSVYLDEFGEEDIDLKRGKPLFLSSERYEKLQEQWLTHNFDAICKKWVLHHNNL